MVVALPADGRSRRSLGMGDVVLVPQTVIEPRRFGIDIDTTPDKNFWLAMVLVPLFWRWSVLPRWALRCPSAPSWPRVRQVIRASAMGGVVLFFALLLDDVTKTHVDITKPRGVVEVTRAGRFGALVLDVEGGGTRAVWRVGIHHDFGGEEGGQCAILARTAGSPACGWEVLASMSEAELEADLGKLGRWLDEHALDRAVITTTVSKREAMLGWVAVLEGKGVELLVVPGALDYMAGTVVRPICLGFRCQPEPHGFGAGHEGPEAFCGHRGQRGGARLAVPVLLVALSVKRVPRGLCFTARNASDCMESPFTSSNSERWCRMRRGRGPS